MNWLRRKVKNWLEGDVNRLVLVSAENSPNTISSMDTFRGDFHGWQFRMHRAQGGTVIEAWRYPKNNNNYSKNPGSDTMEHELFIINSTENFNTELPQILTQLALK